MHKSKTLVAGKKIIIVTHRSLMPDIPGGDLKRFFLSERCSKLLYITHPLLLLKESYQLLSRCEYYKNSQLIKTSKAYHWILPEPILLIKDFIHSIYWTLKTREVYDLYFGVNNLNALAGLLLKKLGRVKKVIYYTIDLYPQRFESPIMNWVYHAIDMFCVKHCDETWNVSPFLVKYRAENGATEKNYSRQFTVPIGIWFDEIKRVSDKKVNMRKIAYVGHLKNFYGVDLIIHALPLIKKRIPVIQLAIVGGGEQLEELQQLAESLGVTQHITFYGWKEKKEAEKLISNAAIGLAPFNTEIIDEKIKNADPAKIKDYLALGLPVIMTNATINSSEIKKRKCGVVIDFTSNALANAVTTLLSDEKVWKEYRKNALQYVRQFDWASIFMKNVSRL